MTQENNFQTRFAYMAKLVKANSPLAVAIGPGQWLVAEISLFHSTETDLEVSYLYNYVYYAPLRATGKSEPFLISQGMPNADTLKNVSSDLAKSGICFTEQPCYTDESSSYFLEWKSPLVFGVVRQDVASVEVSSHKYPEQVQLVRLTEEKTFFWSLGELSEIYGDKFIFVTKDSEGQIIGQAETQVQHWQTTKIGKLLHQYGRFRLYEIISFFDNRQHVFTNAVIITYHGEEHLVTPIVYNETDLAKVIQRVINEIETKDSKENILNEGLKITKDEETKQFIIKKLTEIEEYKQFLREALRELETN